MCSALCSWRAGQLVLPSRGLDRGIEKRLTWGVTQKTRVWSLISHYRVSHADSASAMPACPSPSQQVLLLMLWLMILSPDVSAWFSRHSYLFAHLLFILPLFPPFNIRCLVVKMRTGPTESTKQGLRGLTKTEMATLGLQWSALAPRCLHCGDS